MHISQADGGTRSGLLWEVERLLTELDSKGMEKPQILLMENVPQVIGQKNIKDFQNWEMKLESLGYQNYIEVLNAKNYGLPQNRERAFMVSILGEWNYEFPEPMKLKYRLKDLLEKHVSDKYYLNEKGIEYICGNALNKDLKDRINRSKTKLSKEIAYTINTKQDRRCGDANFILDGYSETSIENFLKIKNATAKGYLEGRDGDGIDISSRMQHHRGTVQKGLAQTLKTQIEVGVVVKEELSTKENNELRIRKLTPRECGRLQGVSNDDITTMSQTQSEASLYHLYGDSICISVLIGIFAKLLGLNSTEIISDYVDHYIIPKE